MYLLFITEDIGFVTDALANYNYFWKDGKSIHIKILDLKDCKLKAYKGFKIDKVFIDKNIIPPLGWYSIKKDDIISDMRDTFLCSNLDLEEDIIEIGGE